jgi:hypothetical protein
MCIDVQEVRKCMYNIILAHVPEFDIDLCEAGVCCLPDWVISWGLPPRSLGRNACRPSSKVPIICVRF